MTCAVWWEYVWRVPKPGRGRRNSVGGGTGAWLEGRWVSCLFPCCSAGVCELVGTSPAAVAKRAMNIPFTCLWEKCAPHPPPTHTPKRSHLLCLKSVCVGGRRALLTATSANSLGKPKGTLRQPRSLSVPEEGSKRPVPRLPRGRGACAVLKPSVESARSALPSAVGSGPPKEIPMQRHVTVVNRSVCVCVCVAGGW